MNDGVPLSLLIGPGEYRVEWELPDPDGALITVAGDVKLSSDRPPRGNAFGDLPVQREKTSSGTNASFPQIHKLPMLRGQLLNGLCVIMIDAVVEVWFPERAAIHARAALLGRDPLVGGAVEVASIEAQVEGLDAVAGIGPIGQVKVPNRVEGGRYLEWSWEAVGQPDSTQIWADADAEVELRFYSQATAPNPFFFRVSFSPVVLVRLSKPTSLDEVLSDWVEPLRRIISLSTGRKERVSYLAIGLKLDGGKECDFQVYGSALHQEPYASSGNEMRVVQRAFLLSPKDMSLLKLLRRWQELRHEHHPLLETYGSMMFAPEQHPRSSFLLLLQSLEGLYGYENSATFAARSKAHTAEHRSVVTAAKKHLAPEMWAFVKKHLSRRPASGLHEVLAQTLASVPVDITESLEASELVAEAVAGPKETIDSYDAIRVVRNDLAHGTRGYSSSSIHEVSRLLESVVRAHLLRILGCSIDAQRREQERYL